MAPLAMRGLKAALNSKGKFRYKNPEAAIDFLVIGGGVVGLAIAQRLTQRYPTKSTFLVERHAGPGQEISSRNSEVIHAGLYYPPQSLKTQLCLRGRHLMYERCKRYHVPCRKTGKLVVAHESQRSYVESLLEKSRTLSWPTRSIQARASQLVDKPVILITLISGDHARELEPDLSKNITTALWSPETGIVDSHAFMESLEKDIVESEGGELAYSTRVVRVDPYKSAETSLAAPCRDGWVVQTVTDGAQEADALLTKTLINASGLSATLVLNSLLPPSSRIPMYFARGSYAGYSGPGISNVSHLIYPCLEAARNKHAFQSLGTHLTLDLQGRVRFGPDLEWISPPTEGPDFCFEEETADFWTQHLVPSESRLEEMHKAVTQYLPGITLEGLRADYVGIRPKLVVSGFQDFVIRRDYADGRDSGLMVSLLGIESPGLTSSLAIAEHVVEDVVGERSSS